MPTLPIYQVDAFTRIRFRGNPAAVVPLDAWLPDAVMQDIAAENNLAETAFFVRTGETYHLRWFTPTVEVDLCGHATLASAHVLLAHRQHPGDEIQFDSLSGRLLVRRRGDQLELDFPSRPAAVIDTPPTLVAGLGASPQAVLRAVKDLAVFAHADDVAALRPDFRLLAQHEAFGVIATAPGEDCDFVSRFFAPRAGVDEDPVTGSAHCTLTPYWVARLGKTTLHARQISRRGGEITCELAGDRVRIAGHAVTYLVGEITV